MTTFRSFGTAVLTLLAILALPAGVRAEPAQTAPAKAQEPAMTPAELAVHNDLSALIEKVQAKLKAGQTTEAALAPELKEFDALRAKYAGDKSETVAWIGIMEARLYLEVLNDEPKGVAILKQEVTAVAGTPLAVKLNNLVAMLEKKAAADSSLAIGKPFPAFQEKDLNGAPLNLAAYKGKVVLVDFWATWCPPCRAELPNVVAAYQKYHSKGFDIIGVSLDSDRAKLVAFMKDNGMTWSQYFDGQGWQNKMAAAYGIQSIPSTFLLDGDGKIVARDLRGPALAAKLAELLAAKS